MTSMQQRIDALDWSKTSIGSREQWPQSLRTAVSICIDSRFPILIWWGPDLVKIYNDAYAPILGDKHPAALGAPGRTVWPEIWPVIGPMLDQVIQAGIATWSDDQVLMMNRHGYLEETYFTFSYSPIRDESGGIGGIFTAVTETTSRVIGERRLDTLRQLAASAGAAKTLNEACGTAAAILATNPKDIPFAALYVRRDGDYERVQAVGDVPHDLPAQTDGTLAVENALTLPLQIAGEANVSALLVVGVSPHRLLDDEYRAFFSLVAGHVTSAMSDATAFEAQRRRAEALAELDRAKTAFFSNISHEFRTPLTLMLGPVEDLLEEGRMEAVDRERLELAHRNALRLLKLVNALLDFSRIEAGRIDAVYEPVELASLTSDLAGVFRSAVERAGLRLIVNTPPLGEPVYVDREMFEKMVLNLLSNALKFTFEGEIEVSLRGRGDCVEVAVRDTGTGIPAEELPHLFERFHRVRNARGRTNEGSGIGLALVNELAKLHGGSVSIESEVNRGSTFTITFPLGTAHLAEGRIGATRTRESTAARADSFIEEALRWSGERPAPEVRRHEGRILLADDNADMRDYVKRLLRDSYDVEAVHDGLDALEAALREPPALVLSDVMMPRMDGFALLRALRENERTREVPVILLSARAGEEAKVEGLDAGADDYLTKPFSAKELLARVHAHVRLQQVRHDAHTAIRESEAKFATAFDRSPLALTITALDDGRLLDVNAGFVRLSGYSREEAVGRTVDELHLWVDHGLRTDGLQKLRLGDFIADVEARFRTKSGEIRFGVIGAAVVEINQRRCILSSVVDITERKRADEALRESERRFREFADTAPAMLWISEADGSCSFISRGWSEFTGQTEEEALGFGWTAAVHPDDRAAAQQAFLAGNTHRLPVSFDYRIRRVNGEYRWAIDTGHPRFSDSGEFLGYIGSVIDITDRKLAEQAKDQFLSTLSHELRTPLTSGYGWVKLLAKSRDPELLDTGLRAIEESFVNQMKLIDDLLDVSRIASGKLRIDLQPLDLGSVIDAAVELVRPSAEAREIALHVHAREPLAVRGDGARLKQIFWNLLANAIKFTPPGGVVDVRVKSSDGFAEVSVTDTGEGIDAKFLPHVFDRFRQADGSSSRRHGGLGLGLSIVASLVEAHGGQVSAHSDGAGKGATFLVRLPLIETSRVLASRSAKPDNARNLLAGARVLIVDDDAAARDVMVAALERAGAVVRPCVNADDAFDAVHQWRPDILVSDLAMPQQDGYSLIRRLRDAGSRVPALAITAYVRAEDEVRVHDAGFQRHVAKPFDPEDLVRAVRDLV
ncbi:MAG TPA: ATP-binding protein [Thermoanaerobaculia bacterium]|nr:ATP-binding protein [Thermoanaerobaculia bacterium]